MMRGVCASEIAWIGGERWKENREAVMRLMTENATAVFVAAVRRTTGARVRPAHEPREQNQMCRAGDRKEFSKALHRTEDDRLKDVHSGSSRGLRELHRLIRVIRGSCSPHSNFQDYRQNERPLCRLLIEK